MPNSKTKKTINIDKETFDRFEYIYPGIASLFINRSLILALQNKEYFEETFFNKKFLEVK